ncbi:hypothetical protein [Acetobacterium sp.]|uniref:hypothetical protein n=1 Tax=Acetobacterium sp. TaxID=1872094 RepID=UPI002F42A430
MLIIKEFDLEEVFLLSEILDKMGLKIESAKLASKVKTGKLENMDDAKAIGKEAIIAIIADLATDFIKSLWKARVLVVKFICNMTGKPEKEVKKMGIKELKQFFTELLDSPDFKDFLASAGE